MTVVQLSAQLIRNFEGCRLQAYWDATGKVWTIGYGHTSNVKEGDVCTQVQAETWLSEDSSALLKAVAGKSTLEASALVSFGYNCGYSAMMRVISGVSKMDEFTHSGGVVLPGLVRRRNIESAFATTSKMLDLFGIKL